MHARLRPYATAGVALVGASVIAIAPAIAPPPLPDLKVAAPPASSEQVQLSALEDLFDLGALPDPITPWIALLGESFGNITTIGEQLVVSGAPALRQVLSNQLDYADRLGMALQGAGEGVVDLITGLPETLASTFELLAQGEIAAALEHFNNELLQGVLAIAVPFLFPSEALTIPVEIAQNVTNVIEALIGSALGIALSGLSPVFGTVSAFGNSAQAAFDAFQAGDPGEAFGSIIDMPATLLDAFLNGYEFNPGILTPVIGGGVNQNGLVATFLVYIPQMIAAALGADITPGPPTGGVGQSLFSRIATFLGLEDASEEDSETSSTPEGSTTEESVTEEEAAAAADDAANAAVGSGDTVNIQVSERSAAVAGSLQRASVTKTPKIDDSDLTLETSEEDDADVGEDIDDVDDKGTGSGDLDESLDTSLDLGDDDTGSGTGSGSGSGTGTGSGSGSGSGSGTGSGSGGLDSGDDDADADASSGSNAGSSLGSGANTDSDSGSDSGSGSGSGGGSGSSTGSSSDD